MRFGTMTSARFAIFLVSSLPILVAYYASLLAMRAHLPGGAAFDLLAYGPPIGLLLIYALAMGALGKTTATHYKVLSLVTCVVMPFVAVVLLFLTACMYDGICL